MKVWDVDNGSQLFAFRGDHNGAVSALAIDSERRRAITGAEDGTVRVWNPNAGNLLATYLPPTASELLHRQGVSPS